MARTSSRCGRSISSSALSNNGESDGADADIVPTATLPRKRGRKKESEDEGDNATCKKKTRKKPKTVKKKPITANDDSQKAGKSKKKSPSKKAAEHQRITETDVLPKLWDGGKAKADGSYTFKIASWNVAGLRALIRKDPDALKKLCKTHDLDMLCLQEHKLQEMHLEDPKLKLKGLLDFGYDEHWSCSTAKKGYSGTAVFVKRRMENKAIVKKGKQATIGRFFNPKKKDNDDDDDDKIMKDDEEDNKVVINTALPVSPDIFKPTDVSFSIGEEIDNEGRVVVIDFPWGSIANVYVPNSGQKLERLDYRTNQWDKFFIKFMQAKQKNRGLPVIWLGDLNIAHKAHDIWNDGAKHLGKQAGVTQKERDSFSEQLEAGFVDAFRQLHPDAKGNYSFWSTRAGNREPNKGLRLDYFVTSKDMFFEDSKVIARDSYMIMDQKGSDHCPIILELEIKGSTE